MIVRAPAPEKSSLAGAAGNAVSPLSFVRHAQGLRVRVNPLARAAVRAQLTTEEIAHWQQAAVALVEAAAAADPQLLMPYARSVPGTTSYGTGPDGPGFRGRRRIPGGWGPVTPDS